jgi:hypothetical protein
MWKSRVSTIARRRAHWQRCAANLQARLSNSNVLTSWPSTYLNCNRRRDVPPFLHHLAWDDAVNLLSKMWTAGRPLISSDLRRSAIGFAADYATCCLVTRSPVARHDRPQSVANAFSLTEMRISCDAAGLHGAIARRAWTWRSMVIYQSDHADH